MRSRHDVRPDPSRSLLRSTRGVAAAVLAILAIFVGGEYLQRLVLYRAERAALSAVKFTDGIPPVRPLSPADPVRDMLRNAWQRLPRPGAEARLETCGLPVYELRMSPKNRALLRRTAEQVTARSLSVGVTRDYVGADFLLDGEWVDVDVKLRGLTALHYMPERPSLRIKFPKHRPLRGMRQINLTDPYDKGLTADWITAHELADQGLVTWDSRFVVLKINGDVVGLFQEIEQFGRSMIDRSGRTEGFIFSGKGQLFGKPEGFGWDKAETAMREFLDCRSAADLDSSRGSCDWEFVQGCIDTDRFARAAAMTALVGSGHAWYGDNLRLYFDPARGRLEPIPWDYGFYAMSPATNPEGESSRTGFALSLLRIPEFRRLRDTRAWWLIQERVEPMIARADSLFAALAGPLALDDRRPGTAKDRAYHERFRSALRSNAAMLRDLYRTHDVSARVVGGGRGGPVVLELENRGKAHLAVQEVRDRSGDSVELAHAIEVDGLWRGTPGQARAEIFPGAGRVVARVVLRNGVTGDTFDVAPEAVAADPLPLAALNPPAVPPGVEGSGRDILLEGRRRLRSTLLVPRGSTLRLEAGLDLRMAKGASILAYGDVVARGTTERPITIGSDDGGGPWGALAIQGASDAPCRVVLEWVTFEGGTGAENERSRFTGSLAVTDGDVTLRNCRFLNGRAIDGINLKYCRIELRDNVFSGSVDDAVDLDFCTGFVGGNAVVGAGGDGLDISGCDVRFVANTIRGCGDKGMSIGERSVAEIRNNLVAECRIGIASKDESRATVVSNGLANLDVGVALYCKKPTFGDPSATVERTTFWNVATAFVEGRGADLHVERSARWVRQEDEAPTHDGLALLVTPSLARTDLRRVLARGTEAPWGIDPDAGIAWESLLPGGTP